MKKVEFKNCILYNEDVKDIIENIKDVHSCITDPPYHLQSIVKRFGKPNSAPTKDDEVFSRSSKGFMGKDWDGGNISFDVDVWKLIFNTMFPGSYLLSFSGARTYHRMACAIEDAGFDIRDQIMWIYGSRIS